MNNSNENNLKITKQENGIKFGIKVIPNSSKCGISGIIDDCLKIKLDVPPIEGKANEKLIKFLSKILNTPKTSITIISGETSKIKIIFINGNVQELSVKLHSVLSALP